MMAVEADTCDGHYTISGCCGFEVDLVRYGRTNAESGQHNFESELARNGIGPEYVGPNVNFFMRAPIGPDGAAGIAESQSKPGDYVDLQVEISILAVLSNCPEELNPAAGANGTTPIRAVAYLAHSASFHCREKITPSNHGIKHLVPPPPQDLAQHLEQEGGGEAK